MINDTLRKTLHSAYTFIRSVEMNKAIAQVTLDHVVQDQIDRLKEGGSRTILDGRGKSVGSRVSRFDELTALEQDIVKLTDEIEKAGSDTAKLQAMGIYETDKTLVNELTKAES